MEQVSQGALRLPEIQRAYVWKPAQVAGLIDSLYRRYPSVRFDPALGDD